MKILPVTISRAAKPCLPPVAIWQMLLTRLLEKHYGLTLNDTLFSDETVIKEHIGWFVLIPSRSNLNSPEVYQTQLFLDKSVSEAFC